MKYFGAIQFLAIAAIAVTLGRFMWFHLSPESQTILVQSPVAPALLAGELQARRLFGIGSGAAGASDRIKNLRLHGTVAGAGIALISVDGRTAKAFHAGDEVAPGIRITMIKAREIEVDQHGIRVSLRIKATPFPLQLH